MGAFIQRGNSSPLAIRGKREVIRAEYVIEIHKVIALHLNGY